MLPITGNVEVCENSKIQLATASPSGGKWKVVFGTGQATIDEDSGELTGVNAGIVTVWYMVATSFGCTDSISTTITVNPLPTATISGSTSACSINNTTLSVELTGTQPWTIVYNNGSSDITIDGITASPYELTVSPAVTTTYSLVSVADLNCSNTANSSATVTIEDPEINLLVNPINFGCILEAPTFNTDTIFSVTDIFATDPKVTVVDKGLIHDGCNYSRTLTAGYQAACGVEADSVSITYSWTLNAKPIIIVAANDSYDYGCQISEPTDTPTFDVSDNCNPSATVTNVTLVPAATLDSCTFTKSWIANYQNACGQDANEVIVKYTWTLNTKPVISVTANGTNNYGCVLVEPTDIPVFIVDDYCNPNAIVTDIIPVAVSTTDSCTFTKGWKAVYQNYCGQYADTVTVTYTWTYNKPIITVAAKGDNNYGCQMSEPTDQPAFDVKDNCNTSAIVTDITLIQASTIDSCTFTKSWIARYQNACGQEAEEVIVTYTWTLNSKPVIAVTANDTKDYGCIMAEPTDMPLFKVYDYCNTNAEVTITEIPVNNVEGCSYIKIWKASYQNACGQSAAEMTVTYKWNLNTKPIITVVNNHSKDYGCLIAEPADVPVFTVNDDCDVNAVVTDITLETANTADGGCIFTKTWRANYKNVCGQDADEVIVKYTWTLNTKPTITVVSYNNNDYGCITAEPTDVPVFRVDDKCNTGASEIVTLSNSTSSDGCNFTKSWIASYTNGCGQSAESVTVTYIWKLDTKPVITVIANNSKDYGCMIYEPTDVPEFNVTDNCNTGATVTVTSIAASSFDDSNFTKSWKANYQSACGQFAEEVIVTYKWILNVKPTIILPNPTMALCRDESIEIELNANVTPITAKVEWFDLYDKTIGTGETVYAVPPSADKNVYHTEYTYKVVATLCDQIEYAIVKVAVDELPTGNISGDNIICENNSVTLNASSYKAETYTWTSDNDWDFEETSGFSINVTPATTSTYKVKVTRGVCDNEEDITVNVSSLPKVAYIDSIGAFDRKIVLDDQYGTPPFTYGLDDPYTMDGSAEKYNMNIGVRKFYIEDAFGCKSEFVYTLAAPLLIIPPFFSPDGDGVNDRWEIVNINVFPNAIITIYDRFGKQLIQYKGSELGWDGRYLGRDMPTTDYWYVIDVGEISKRYAGHFTLLRK